MTLQIIGGRFRRQTLITPKGTQVRPSTGQLREALFNICQGTVQGSSFLDLFAGCGAVGLEALSRGAQHATFIEQDSTAVKAIRDNLARLKIASDASVLAGDVFRLVLQLAKQAQQFDLIFADPPYAQINQGLSYSHQLLMIFDKQPILRQGGSLFIEEAVEAAPPPQELTHLLLKNQRRYGRSVLQEWVHR